MEQLTTESTTVTTTDGAVGRNFVTAPAGLTAAVMVHHGTIVRRALGPVVGYACFEAGESEAVYAAGGGLQRAGSAPLGLRYDEDAEFKVIR